MQPGGERLYSLDSEGDKQEGRDVDGLRLRGAECCWRLVAPCIVPHLCPPMETGQTLNKGMDKGCKIDRDGNSFPIYYSSKA